MKNDRESLEKMLHNKSGPLIRPMCSLFRNRLEVKYGFGISTTKCFNDEGNKNDTLTTALFEVLSVFTDFHLLKG